MYILFIWILFGIGAAIVASQKGRSGFLWFLLGVILGPFGLLFALIVKPQDVQVTVSPTFLPPGEFSLDQETKKCPHCAEIIKLEAYKCRYCGEPLDPEITQQEIAARRDKLARLAAGDKQCLRCGSWEVYRATIEDGGQGWWCPHCKMSLKKIHQTLRTIPDIK